MPDATPAPPPRLKQLDAGLPACAAGCWQLSGGHKGDKATDRTAGRDAIADFGAFRDAGITSFDMADHYGDDLGRRHGRGGAGALGRQQAHRLNVSRCIGFLTRVQIIHQY